MHWKQLCNRAQLVLTSEDSAEKLRTRFLAVNPKAKRPPVGGDPLLLSAGFRRLAMLKFYWAPEGP